MTDINAALQMASAEVKQFVAGKFKTLGNYKVKNHSVFRSHKKDVTTIPNVRVLLYTDGLQYTGNEQNIKDSGKIINPFKPGTA